jgi:hypothetical protein
MDNGVDFTFILPLEIIVEIISFLPFRDTGRIRRTCKLLSMIQFENRYAQQNPTEVAKVIKLMLFFSNQYAIKQWLLPCVSYTNITDYFLHSLAYNIVISNDQEIVQKLLMNPSATTSIFNECLHRAIPKGYTNIVRLVLPRADVTHSDFMMAIDSGYIEIVQLLLPGVNLSKHHIGYAQHRGKLEIVHLLQTFSGSPGSTNPAAPSCPPPL